MSDENRYIIKILVKGIKKHTGEDNFAKKVRVARRLVENSGISITSQRYIWRKTWEKVEQ